MSNYHKEIPQSKKEPNLSIENDKTKKNINIIRFKKLCQQQTLLRKINSRYPCLLLGFILLGFLPRVYM
jgi:hypothetical protein